MRRKRSKRVGELRAETGSCHVVLLLMPDHTTTKFGNHFSSPYSFLTGRGVTLAYVTSTSLLRRRVLRKVFAAALSDGTLFTSKERLFFGHFLRAPIFIVARLWPFSVSNDTMIRFWTAAHINPPSSGLLLIPCPMQNNLRLTDLRKSTPNESL